MTGLRDVLDARTAEYRLLDHPFYKAWAGGSLSTEDLGFYSTQYWRQVEAFPDYLSVLAERMAPGRQRAIVESNLSDEVEGNHAGLWIDFASSVGVGKEQLENSPSEPETEECVKTFSQGARQESTAFALGMLYGYESQTPEVARTKADGLRTLYGIDSDGTRYFDLHAELDVEHSSELADAIEDSLTDRTGLDDAARGAAQGAAAVWSLLDGVARVRKVPAVR
ncbi:MAG: pyrroloquinoline-quinone synthase [Actinomycetota bacterium]|jgi:pyrroloquinoline-quinone synthase|nr:pyrroloquinoline-quinone synthase [Actinomycetota bacterium]